MELLIHPFDLKLRNTFKTAHSQRDIQKSFVVELKNDEFSGFGEVTVNTYFGISQEAILEGLNLAKVKLVSFKFSTPEALHDYLLNDLKIASFPLCAIDEAAYDLYGKIYKLPTRNYIGADNGIAIMTDYTIGIASIDKMVEKMEAMPWPIYKIKLGTNEDIEIVKALREHSDSVFRIDANCGWTADETIENAKKLKELGVEFIEQPLDPGDWEGMKKVFAESVLPVVADESCMVEEDVDKCEGYFHGINIKLTKCGGITAGRRMIENARSKGMKVMAGCMTESTVGISAVTQLAPLLDYIDADGSLLITNDPATGVTFDYGKIIYSDHPGNGVQLR